MAAALDAILDHGIMLGSVVELPLALIVPSAGIEERSRLEIQRPMSRPFSLAQPGRLS
jgi:hypothetical protein